MKAVKIPGGQKINFRDDRIVDAFDSHFPNKDKQLYMVPPYLKRNSFFDEDEGYDGEQKVATALMESNLTGVLICNFSSSDKNQIFQTKSQEKFECDFIFVTSNLRIWIIEVRKSKSTRILNSIEEKFEQVCNNRRHILGLAREIFNDISVDVHDLNKVCNGVVLIPGASSEDYATFKSTPKWEKFINGEDNFAVKFLGKEHLSDTSLFRSQLESSSSDSSTSMQPSDLKSFLQRFTAIMALSKLLLTNSPCYKLESSLSKSEKRSIKEVTGGMHPDEYNLILSPEQWSILKELPPYLQIIGEAATGKTEMLKALMFMILNEKVRTIQKAKRNITTQSTDVNNIKRKSQMPKYKPDRKRESKLAEIAKDVKRIVFLILGDKPYLKKNIEDYNAFLRNKLHLPSDLDIVEIQSIVADSAEEVSKKFLLSVLEKDCGKSFFLIDECYYSIDALEYACDRLKGCWVSSVISGQHLDEYLRNISTVDFGFTRTVFRRVYRGSKQITIAGSTIKLASPLDSPLYLANCFSYIFLQNDMVIESFSKAAETLREIAFKNPLVTCIRDQSSSY